MYQGKYQQNNNDILPTTNAPAMDLPTSDTGAEEIEFKRPVRRPKKKPIRTATLVFWTCVLSFVLLSVIGICIGLNIFKDWLINFEYESTLPETKSQAVFDQLFADPDWEYIYRLAKETDTKFEDGKAYATYMKQIVGDQELRQVKISAGLSNDHKYEIRLNGKKIAGYTLQDSTTADGKKDLTLGNIEIIYERKEACTILTVPGATVKVNGVALDENYVIKTVSTNASEYLPAGIKGFESVLYRVENLLVAPEVSVTAENGEAITLDYDADVKAYSHFIGSVAITESEETVLINTLQAYCKYINGPASKDSLKAYFDTSSDYYKIIPGKNDLWMQNNKGYHFDDATITEYYRYSDTLFSARVKMSMFVTRNNNTQKEYPVHTTLIMELQDGTWKATNLLNLSIQQIETAVRITYFDGDRLLLNEMVDADSNTLTTPTVEIPEGKQLGWYTKTVNENGNTTMTLLFQPDENGKVTLPDDYTLEPLVLYARLTNKEA